MDKAQLISEVKELVGNAEMEKALNRLAEFLQSKPEYKALYNLVLQSRAQFQKTQRDEIQGLASSEQTKLGYNQVTRQILQAAEWLEEGNLRPDAGFTKKSRPGSRLWVAAAIVLALVLAGGGYWLFLASSTEEPEVVQTADCPIDEKFDETSEFNILLRPFQSVAGESQRPHVLIANSLQAFIKGLRIKCDFGTLKVEDTDRFYSDADADEDAMKCGADLFIWGITESSPSRPITIKTFYKFFSRGDRLMLSKLKGAEGSELATVETLSSILTSGVLTQGIEEDIKLLFGLIAHETRDSITAISMLEGYQPEDSTTLLLKGMVLAEDYLATHQKDKAWESYNQVLEIHPNYAIARNNRGVLNYQKGNYMEAVEDLSVALEKEKDSSIVESILKTRSSAYLNVDHLKEAREDLQKVQTLRKIPDREINQKIKEVDQKILEEEKVKASAEAEIRANPNNLSAWNQKAISSAKLGNYREAVSAGEAILRRDPDNLDAFVQIIKAYRSAGDTTQAEKVIQRAEAAGITRQQLEGLTPFKLIQPPASRFPIERKIN